MASEHYDDETGTPYEETSTTYVECPNRWPTIIFAATSALLAGMWYGRDRYRTEVIRAVEQAQARGSSSVWI